MKPLPTIREAEDLILREADNLKVNIQRQASYEEQVRQIFKDAATRIKGTREMCDVPKLFYVSGVAARMYLEKEVKR
jgi:hypothetical protein